MLERCRKIYEKRNKTIRNVKVFLILFALFFIIFDVVLLSDKNPYPTLSKVVLYSSPRFLVFVWLFGLLSTHFFFPRKAKDIDSGLTKKTSLLLGIATAGLLTFFGFGITKQTDCELLDFPTFDNIPFYMSATCRNYYSNRRVPCATLQCRKKGSISRSAYTELNYQLVDQEETPFILKYDITSEIKLLLLVFGFFFGYYVWPQRID